MDLHLQYLLCLVRDSSIWAMDSLNSNNGIRDCDNEHSLDEMFLMYGIQSNGAETQADDHSISSDNSETLDERLNSQLFVVRASVDGKTILSQFPIEESESIAAHLVERNARGRVSCLEFRSMLQPISKDKVPVRDEAWLRNCMRGILISAALGSDALEDWPSHVYCWFMENHDDEEAWSFYYSLKQHATSDAEACLHYQILNDVNLDFAAFFVDTLVFMKSLTDQSWLEDLENECQQQRIWIPTDVTKRVISHMFSWTDPPLSIEDLNRKVEGESEEEQGRVDLFSFLQVLMRTHVDQIKKQTTLLRVLFDTVQKNVDVSVDRERLVSLRELYQILKSFHEPVTLSEATHLYRDAYDLLVAKTTTGYAPRGIIFDCFLFAAKRRGLFTRIRRRGMNKES